MVANNYRTPEINLFSANKQTKLQVYQYRSEIFYYMHNKTEKYKRHNPVSDDTYTIQNTEWKD